MFTLILTLLLLVGSTGVSLAGEIGEHRVVHPVADGVGCVGPDIAVETGPDHLPSGPSPRDPPLRLLQSEYYFAGGEIVSSPKPINLTGDPRPGIVFGTSLGQIYVLTADGVPAPGFPVTSGSMVGYSSAAVADLDGDGLDDIVFHANNSLAAFAQDGSVLPGWPQTLDQSVSGNSLAGSPIVADIDDDHDLEILVGHFYRMYAFHHDGTAVTGWPIFQAHPFGPLYSTPAVGDLDGDGDAEICFKIYGGNGDPADIYLFHHDGSPVGGWPKLGLDRSHLSSPIFADIDSDGRLDIVVSLHFYSGGNYVRVYVWKADGSDAAGFPVSGSWNTAPENMSVGDVDGDGFAEIFVSTWNGTSPFYAIHAWNHDGTVLSGAWPRSAPLCLTNSSPALADVDGGQSEVIVGTGGCYVNDNGILNVWAGDGSPLSTWPRSVSGWLRSSPLVIDSDGDGTPEIYTGTSDGWIHRFLTGNATGRAEWNQIFHDKRNTNCWCPAGPTPVADHAPRMAPAWFALSAPWPNPFRHRTEIGFDVPAPGGEVRLSIYSVRGRRIVDLADGYEPAGHHTLTWHGLDRSGKRLGAGIYFVRLVTPSYVESREITLVE